ncbi:PREDICTED: transmembrane protein 132C [Thamnophis sirtalis]|uniref:Transmembrane protein 132C n=1 Tax=Thamnophis sirtalis TaxID=35019 RepID=A0A6I9XFA5_9SAUR|nr:PREDICTED: transmembrane protein 132C [Thamnophis sirtalis]
MGRVALDNIQKFSSLSAYLPVKYQISGTESSFFLREANHEFMKNSSLQSRVETFFTYKSKKRPIVSVSYGPFLVEHDVPQDLLWTSSTFGPTNKFTFNWKLKTYIMSEKIYLTKPKVQILFYIVGRDWDDYSMSEQLPCMHVFAFWETLGVRGSCRLKGDLGLCVASLELQPTWFNPPTVVTGRKKMADRSDGISVELYYAIHPGSENGECSTEDLRKGNAIRPGKEGAGERMSHLQRVGSISLHQAPESSQLTELWLDSNIVIQLPLKPVKQGEVVTASVTVTNNITVDQFILRCFITWLGNSIIRMKEGCGDKEEEEDDDWGFFMLVRSNNNNMFSEVVRLNFEIASFSSLSGTQPISWQVEYPQKKMTEMALSEIFICQKDLVGIVPLAMDTDILNTAILTGKTVAVPVKVISVEENNMVMDISESVECKSFAEDVVKGLFPPCQRVLNYEKRLTRDSEDEDEDERKGRGCTLQYQHAMVRVLTQFVAEDASPSGQLSYLLGSDWQMDITDLVTDFMKLEKPHVAQLQGGKVLVGQEVGMTMVQVLSPLSDSILAEKTVMVLDDKVTITDMGIQLVAGLSLVLQPSTASHQAFVATTIAQDLLHTHKQEAMVSSWIQFSDGAVTPLDIYDPRDFSLSASSLDESVVTAHQSSAVKWPVVVAEGEGEGLLVKVDMMISESCQKSKRKSILAIGNGNIKVKFGQNDGNPHSLGDYSAEEIENHASDRRQKVLDQDHHGQEGQYYRSSSAEREESPARKNGVTAKSTTKNKVFKSIPEGDKLSDEGLLQNIPIDFTNFPAQIDLPHSNNGMKDNDLVETPRGLSDLETGMYALLGVFCLAILVFLINCATFTLKYRHKQLPMEGQTSMNHSHDWVWLGNEMELLDNPADVSPPPDECTTIIDQGIGFDMGSQLLVGTPKKLPSQSSPKIQLGDKQIRDLKQENPLHSPASKRKRVKFTTFTTIPPDDGCPTVNSILNCNEDDIKWVCQDMDLGESKQIRNYLEKLKDKM